MRHIAIVVCVVAAMLAGCGAEDQEDAVIEDSAEALQIGGPIFTRPSLSSFSPPSAAPGATVTLYGGGFDTLLRGFVAFGSTTDVAAQAALTYVSPTQMTTVVPAGARPGPIYIMSSITLNGQPPTVQLQSAQSFTPIVAPAAPSGLV